MYQHRNGSSDIEAKEAATAAAAVVTSPSSFGRKSDFWEKTKRVSSTGRGPRSVTPPDTAPSRRESPCRETPDTDTTDANRFVPVDREQRGGGKGSHRSHPHGRQPDIILRVGQPALIPPPPEKDLTRPRPRLQRTRPRRPPTPEGRAKAGF